MEVVSGAPVTEVARRYGVSLRAQHVDPRRGTGVDWHLSGKPTKGPALPAGP